MTGDKQKCFDAGMDDYVTKPLMMHVLRERLNVHLKRVSEDMIGHGDEAIGPRKARTNSGGGRRGGGGSGGGGGGGVGDRVGRAVGGA